MAAPHVPNIRSMAPEQANMQGWQSQTLTYLDAVLERFWATQDGPKESVVPGILPTDSKLQRNGEWREWHAQSGILTTAHAIRIICIPPLSALQRVDLTGYPHWRKSAKRVPHRHHQNRIKVQRSSSPGKDSDQVWRWGVSLPVAALSLPQADSQCTTKSYLVRELVDCLTIPY
ncbi:Hypothetical predicted protein [Pelobates cultripes]|uniref:Uncharacterized protein n=1 Tax=Pelobates cultripes TaxID=61616 RepID=A0AAD1W8N7_PELCU|nr:Hypothetical predicted protein [Pelobates cultripes]